MDWSLGKGAINPYELKKANASASDSASTRSVPPTPANTAAQNKAIPSSTDKKVTPTAIGTSKASGGNPEDSKALKKKKNDIYDISDDKALYWWVASPYAFRSVSSSGVVREFCLPINPSNLQITTHFATNMIPTMYGTIEEHSDQRYYDITINGTTGFAPKYVNSYPSTNTYPIQPKEYTDKKDVDPIYSSGRERYAISYSAVDPNAAFGLFQKQLEMVNKALDKVKDLTGPMLGNGDPLREVSGVSAKRSGYMAFHNFYRFLLDYKKAVMSRRRDIKGIQSNPLCFINYKDAMMYNVVIQTFQLMRSAEDPMLYNYTIVMRAYNLRGIAEFQYDMAPSDSQIAAQLGIDGIKESSIFATIKDNVSGAKSVASAAAGSIKGF